jgi:hypothetical protein
MPSKIMLDDIELNKHENDADAIPDTTNISNHLNLINGAAKNDELNEDFVVKPTLSSKTRQAASTVSNNSETPLNKSIELTKSNEKAEVSHLNSYVRFI